MGLDDTSASRPRLRPLPRLPRPRFSWLVMIAAALGLALVLAVLLQARQFAVWRKAMQASDEHAMRVVYQTQVQTLRLHEQWRRISSGATPLDIDVVRVQFVQWQAVVSELQSKASMELLGEVASYRQLSTEAAEFVAAADAALGDRPLLPVTGNFVAGLLPALQALDDPVQALAQAAAGIVDQRTAQRREAVRQQNQFGLALTAFLAVLTLVLASIALWHLNQLRRRRHLLERQALDLDQARRDAEQANEAKSIFLANMSHEVRTPFHGLMGMLSILRETGLTPRQNDYLRTATESADHLLAVLNDILDMSQLETGRVSINLAPIDLRVLLRDVEALMRPQATTKSLALHLETEPSLPECIMGDSTRIKQILLNLLSNAIKFSDRGAVVLEVRGGSDEQSQPTLQFVVSDTGVGMDEATRRQLFQRSMRGHSASSRRHAGTGLGLEISRKLARLMQGEITVTSRPGDGSVFTFSMPLQALADCASDARAAAGATSAAAGPATQRLLVLVAEDNPVNRQYMAALLDKLGHTAHFTANGAEAVHAAQQQAFDLVLMDLHMPVLDGLSATRAIRALANRTAATVPIVALTADALDETRERCLVAGMNDFLTKPVSPQKLASTLRRLFGSAVCTGNDIPPPNRSHLATSANGQSVIDHAALNLLLQAMPHDRLTSLIAAYLDQGPQTVERLRAAVRDAQPLALRVNAHAAKGAALNLGLSALAATAGALHEGAAHLPAHEIARLVQRFADLLPQTRDAVRAAGLACAAGTVTG